MLPHSVRVIVRDWLNANHIVLAARGTVLIDSGYGRDSVLTLSSVSEVLAGRPLDWLGQHPLSFRPHGRQRSRAPRASMPRQHSAG